MQAGLDVFAYIPGELTKPRCAHQKSRSPNEPPPVGRSSKLKTGFKFFGAGDGTRTRACELGNLRRTAALSVVYELYETEVPGGRGIPEAVEETEASHISCRYPYFFRHHPVRIPSFRYARNLHSLLKRPI